MENTKKDVQHEKIAKKGARIMIAAPQSGSGKTLITCALLQALKEKNYHLESFKCGPDYIDPMFHKTVLGISSRNLDPFFTEDSVTRMLLSKGQDSRDLAVIEGVMGLYDGLGGIREEASSYALAKATNTPILLTVNARGMGRSLLALLSGFLQYDTAHLIKGVILNQTPSSFASVLAKEIEETFHIPVVASFPVRDDVRIESRHLGLVMPYELEDIQSRLKIASQVLCENANIEQILEIANSAPKLEYDVKSDIKHKITEKTIRIGVARDEAFCFYYEDNLDLLKSLGAKLIFFSPLHDDTLPKDLDGILFGGGYPELYLKELEENESMRNSVKSAIENKMPSLAECGGFMYLHDTIFDSEKKPYKMAGVIHAGCMKKERLVRFGYLTLNSKTDSFLKKGETIRGHEFHYYDSEDNGECAIAKKPVGTKSWECVHAGSDHWWGFAHLSYYSNPKFAEKFAEACRSYKINKIAEKK
ncbi:MAG: cobyrinate a,c-diamide synthase [Lachnospiraceae bacterium]